MSISAYLDTIGEIKDFATRAEAEALCRTASLTEAKACPDLIHLAEYGWTKNLDALKAQVNGVPLGDKIARLINEHGGEVFALKEVEEPKQYARNRDNADMLASVLGGYALKDWLFVPDSGGYQRVKIVTLQTGDAQEIQESEEKPERVVVIDDRDETSGGKYSGHDLYYHYGQGKFKLADAKVLADPEELKQAILDTPRLIPEDMDDDDPMRDDVRPQMYEKRSFLDGMAQAFWEELPSLSHSKPSARDAVAMADVVDAIKALAEKPVPPPVVNVVVPKPTQKVKTQTVDRDANGLVTKTVTVEQDIDE